MKPAETRHNAAGVGRWKVRGVSSATLASSAFCRGARSLSGIRIRFSSTISRTRLRSQRHRLVQPISKALWARNGNLVEVQLLQCGELLRRGMTLIRPWRCSGSSSWYLWVLVRAARSSPEFGGSPVLAPSGHQRRRINSSIKVATGRKIPRSCGTKKGWPSIRPDFLEAWLLRLVAPEPTAQLIIRWAAAGLPRVRSAARVHQDRS
jgi:hypothetical protein